MKLQEQNNKNRIEFVNLWSKYILSHNDKTWSRQQNKVINSQLRTSKITKNEFLFMKNELKE